LANYCRAGIKSLRGTSALPQVGLRTKKPKWECHNISALPKECFRINKIKINILKRECHNFLNTHSSSNKFILVTKLPAVLLEEIFKLIEIVED
jgi:hypothetical protein